MNKKIITMAGLLLLLMNGRPTYVSGSELLFPGEATSRGEAILPGGVTSHGNVVPLGSHPADVVDYGELKRMNDLKEKEMEERRKEKEAQEELRKERELQSHNEKKRAERINKVERTRGKKCTSWQLLNR